jgi:hypothetical protein
MLSTLKRRRGRTSLVQNTESEIAWRYCDRIAPGEYPAYARSAKIYRDGQYKRWICAVQFDILDSSLTEIIAELTWYLNLGPGEKPYAGRRSAFWVAWIQANGTQPKRGDRLSPRVFVKRHALVAVGYTTKNHQQIAVDVEAGYSVVRGVLQWQTGTISK